MKMMAKALFLGLFFSGSSAVFEAHAGAKRMAAGGTLIAGLLGAGYFGKKAYEAYRSLVMARAALAQDPENNDLLAAKDVAAARFLQSLGGAGIATLASLAGLYWVRQEDAPKTPDVPPVSSAVSSVSGGSNSPQPAIVVASQPAPSGCVPAAPALPKQPDTAKPHTASKALAERVRVGEQQVRNLCARLDALSRGVTNSNVLDRIKEFERCEQESARLTREVLPLCHQLDARYDDVPVWAPISFAFEEARQGLQRCKVGQEWLAYRGDMQKAARQRQAAPVRDAEKEVELEHRRQKLFQRFNSLADAPVTNLTHDALDALQQDLDEAIALSNQPGMAYATAGGASFYEASRAVATVNLLAQRVQLICNETERLIDSWQGEPATEAVVDDAERHFDGQYDTYKLPKGGAGTPYHRIKGRLQQLKGLAARKLVTPQDEKKLQQEAAADAEKRQLEERVRAGEQEARDLYASIDALSYGDTDANIIERLGLVEGYKKEHQRLVREVYPLCKQLDPNYDDAPVWARIGSALENAHRSLKERAARLSEDTFRSLAGSIEMHDVRSRNGNVQREETAKFVKESRGYVEAHLAAGRITDSHRYELSGRLDQLEKRVFGSRESRFAWLEKEVAEIEAYWVGERLAHFLDDGSYGRSSVSSLVGQIKSDRSRGLINSDEADSLFGRLKNLWKQAEAACGTVEGADSDEEKDRPADKEDEPEQVWTLPSQLLSHFRECAEKALEKAREAGDAQKIISEQVSSCVEQVLDGGTVPSLNGFNEEIAKVHQSAYVFKAGYEKDRIDFHSHMPAGQHMQLAPEVAGVAELVGQAWAALTNVSNELDASRNKLFALEKVHRSAEPAKALAQDFFRSACVAGKFEEAQQLMARGLVDVNAVDAKGNTVFMELCSNTGRWLQAIQMLEVIPGINVDIANKDGKLPSYYPSLPRYARLHPDISLALCQAIEAKRAVKPIPTEKTVSAMQAPLGGAGESAASGAGGGPESLKVRTEAGQAAASAQALQTGFPEIPVDVQEFSALSRALDAYEKLDEYDLANANPEDTIRSMRGRVDALYKEGVISEAEFSAFGRREEALQHRLAEVSTKLRLMERACDSYNKIYSGTHVRADNRKFFGRDEAYVKQLERLASINQQIKLVYTREASVENLLAAWHREGFGAGATPENIDECLHYAHGWVRESLKSCWLVQYDFNSAKQVLANSGDASEAMLGVVKDLVNAWELAFESPAAAFKALEIDIFQANGGEGDWYANFVAHSLQERLELFTKAVGEPGAGHPAGGASD